jgi:5-formyltetrahydrofolate cyclo-ligase
MNKSELRKLIRQQRRSLSKAQRHNASRGLLRQLRSTPEYLAAKRVAVYLTNDGEIDTQWLIQDLQQRCKEIYLPVLHPLRKGHLTFIRYQKNTVMSRNRFGISEPSFRHNKALSARFIRLICLPLVAFDERGNRLGMGGGFYDRTLAFTHKKGHLPLLVGCAYDFQRISILPAESWDIPLKLIATDTSLYRLLNVSTTG